MNSRLRRALRWLPLLLLVPASASAHFFTQPYTLPVPFSMYAFSASAALVLSFIVVGVFATAPALAARPEVAEGGVARAPSRNWRLCVGRGVSLALLLLCIATGLFGTQNAFGNFNMTFFWIVFVLGVPYAAALIGDFYAALNPWKALVEWVEQLLPVSFEGRTPYPQHWSYYPALVLYMVFIWLELFGRLSPFGLSMALSVYTGLNLMGAWVWGKQAWFRYGEFFAVLMSLMGRMSPRARPWDPEEAAACGETRRWRAPFVGLMERRAPHVSLVVFILFMLSSTAFDGLHSTLPWVTVFWKGIYPGLEPLVVAVSQQPYRVAAQLYHIWQWCSLLVSPLLYLFVFVAFVWAAKYLTRSAMPLKMLLLQFAMSLVPIAFVYHVTHYYTLFLAQVGQLAKLVSDPFGFGWNLFGTARQTIEPMLIDVEAIWHTQVALILLGHIVSVYLAHLEALQTFSSPRHAAVSQLPMLVLMMLFTTLGLWILSLPLAAG